MSWPRAGPGRPRGSPNKPKPFKTALAMEVAARQAEGDFKGLRKIAAALFDKAEGGDVQAIREIGDRLDGKVAQTLAGDDELPPVGIIVTGVVRAGDAED